MTIEQVVATHDFGKATAHKRGRNPKFPYVPVIMTTDRLGRDHQEQIRAKAFVVREEAVEYAQAVIAHRRSDLAEKLANPRYRALREQHGLPREIAV